MKNIALPLVPLLATAASTLAAATAFDEGAALAVLASDADVEKKVLACQQLAIKGGPKSVPAFAALLGDEKLADYARTGLETIQDPAAGEALRKALTQLKGRLLIGAVTSLGARRDVGAVPDLQRLIADPKSGAAEPAMAALGEIASEDALGTISKSLSEGPAELRLPAAHAALVAMAKLAKDGKRDAVEKIAASLQAAQVPDYIKAAAGKQVAGRK